jgi:hypothetical protein
MTKVEKAALGMMVLLNVAVSMDAPAGVWDRFLVIVVSSLLFALFFTAGDRRSGLG